MSEKWINQSGGDFATHDAVGFGIDITVEELLKMDPEVIVIGGVYNEKMEREFYESEALSQIRAVQDGEIYAVPVGVIPWDQYGLEYPLLCLWTAKTLYPEHFEDIDMVKEIIDFYSEFCGITLSEKEAGYMLDGKDPNGESLSNE